MSSSQTPALSAQAERRCAVSCEASMMLRPMLASLADAPLDDPQLVYEPKYDGIRAIVEIEPKGARPSVVAARQREDARSFPRSPRRSANGRARARQPLVLDGEIVALDADGRAGRLPAAAGTHSPVGGRRVPRRRDGARSRSTSCATARTDLPRPAAARAARRARTDVRRRPARRSCASASRCAATAARSTSRRSSRAGKA